MNELYKNPWPLVREIGNCSLCGVLAGVIVSVVLRDVDSMPVYVVGGGIIGSKLGIIKFITEDVARQITGGR